MTLAQWFSFNGRISRKTWWVYYFLLPNGFIIAAGLFDAYFLERDQISVVSIVVLSTYILGFSGQVKRWHDLDRTGWWACLAMIPPFVGVWFFLILAVRIKGSLLALVFLPLALPSWVLVYFIPILGSLWSFFVAGFQPGTPGPNRYGPEPLAPLPATNIAQSPSP
ncbi:MAG: DUF805 domain-containing protein [Roseomonas sp.]|nr:DUF805 domain-containing protein [Roseomonas sp.]